MIKASEVKMLHNYVLVLPDPQIETYQLKGSETGLFSPDFKYEKEAKISVKERNYSSMGTVYAVPQDLVFNGEEVDRIKKYYHLFKLENGEVSLINLPMHKYMKELHDASVNFKVNMELEIGDRVNFSYTAHKKTKESKLVVDTDLGEMYLIKYDMLYMVIDENNNPKRMLNGYVLVEPEEIETAMEDGVQVVKHDSGLVTLAPKNKAKRRKKTQIGNVVLAGKHCEGYLQERHKSDHYFDLCSAERILYDTRAKQNLEYENHQIISSKTLHLIQRKDIHFVYPKEGSCLI